MEFGQVVAQRRMVRRFRDQPVEEDFLRRALTHATRAPSAGFTQGWGFLTLRTPAAVNRFWSTTGGEGSNAWLDGMKTAPVIVVVFASAAAYRERYGESDKAGAHPRAAGMPWWQIDAAMASLLILQTATDEGYGACFFGVPEATVAALRETFEVPGDYSPIGAIALGHPASDRPTGSPTRRPRKSFDEVVHDGKWGQTLRLTTPSVESGAGDAAE